MKPRLQLRIRKCSYSIDSALKRVDIVRAMYEVRHRDNLMRVYLNKYKEEVK